MKKMKQERAIVMAFIVCGVSVLGTLLFNVMFQTQSKEVMIWSGKGFAVLFLEAIALLATHLIMHHEEKETIKKSLCQKIMISLCLIYFVGICLGSLVLHEFDMDTTITPMWSNAGAWMCYWCAALGWCSGYFIRKTD